MHNQYPYLKKRLQKCEKAIIFQKDSADHLSSFHYPHTETSKSIVKRGCTLVLFLNIACFNISIVSYYIILHYPNISYQ